MCARHSAGAVKNSPGWSAPLWNKKSGWRAWTWSHSQAARHTVLAPVAVNEHRAAPHQSCSGGLFERKRRAFPSLLSRRCAATRPGAPDCATGLPVNNGFRLYGRPQADVLPQLMLRSCVCLFSRWSRSFPCSRRDWGRNVGGGCCLQTRKI